MPAAMPPQVMPNPYGQLPYPGQYQLPVTQQPQLPVPQVQAQANAYLPQGVTPAVEAVPSMAQPLSPPVVQAAPTQAAPKQELGELAGGTVPTSPDGQTQGLLHIAMHDWEPDQPGQLWVTKGTLVNVSYRAAHGWVYAGTAQPPGDSMETAVSEGWIPQAVVKRVSLCRVSMDWPAEGGGTLGVNKGEIIAVSKEAERGWAYGERIGPRQSDRPVDGWLPKKVLDYIQS